jgi:hypothetical protein
LHQTKEDDGQTPAPSFSGKYPLKPFLNVKHAILLPCDTSGRMRVKAKLSKALAWFYVALGV